MYFTSFQTITIQGGGELMNYVHGLDFLPGFALEGFANRDSLSYIEAYGLHDAHTVLRGTLRYNGRKLIKFTPAIFFFFF